MQPTPDFIQAAILKAVRQYVAAAIQSRSIITAADFAAEIARAYPAYDFDQLELINEIALTAANAGVPVEIGAPKAGGMISP